MATVLLIGFASAEARPRPNRRRRDDATPKEQLEIVEKGIQQIQTRIEGYESRNRPVPGHLRSRLTTMEKRKAELQRKIGEENGEDQTASDSPKRDVYGAIVREDKVWIPLGEPASVSEVLSAIPASHRGRWQDFPDGWSDKQIASADQWLSDWTRGAVIRISGRPTEDLSATNPNNSPVVRLPFETKVQGKTLPVSFTAVLVLEDEFTLRRKFRQPGGRPHMEITGLLHGSLRLRKVDGKLQATGRLIQAARDPQQINQTPSDLPLAHQPLPAGPYPTLEQLLDSYPGPHGDIGKYASWNRAQQSKFRQWVNSKTAGSKVRVALPYSLISRKLQHQPHSLLLRDPDNKMLGSKWELKIAGPLPGTVLWRLGDPQREKDVFVVEGVLEKNISMHDLIRPVIALDFSQLRVVEIRHGDGTTTKIDDPRSKAPEESGN